MGFTEHSLGQRGGGVKFGKDAWGRGVVCSGPAVSYLRLGLDGNAAHFALSSTCFWIHRLAGFYHWLTDEWSI